MGILHVVAAAVLDPRGLLLVSKRSAPRVFFLPGGKPERGESALECLDRELLLALGYAFEQATKARKAPSEPNPASWRCVPGSALPPRSCPPGDPEPPSEHQRW